MEAGTMGTGRLKQRLFRLFRFACKPSGASAVSSAASTTQAPLLEDAVLQPVFVPDRRLEHHAARPRRSVDCGGGCRPSSRARTTPPKGRSWKKERRIRETGGYYETGEWEGMTCPPASPSSPSRSSFYFYCFNDGGSAAAAVKAEKKEEETKRKTKKKKKKKKKAKRTLQWNGYGFSSSFSMGSDDDDEEEEEDGRGFFSSEEREGKGEETEAFFSSRSFSSDSSEFYQRPGSKKTSKNKNEKNKKSKKKPPRPLQNEQCSQRRKKETGRGGGGGGGCKGFQPLISAAPEAKKKKRAGFAVVKRSSDPYGDFRSSMAEMIIERQIFGAEDLESLLQSYLSLNSKHLHPLILQAFSDIWVILLDQ